MVYRSLLLAWVCCWRLAWAEPVSVSARAGEFVSKSLGRESSSASVSGRLRFVKTHGTEAWPARAGVGLFQGGAENMGVQLVLLQPLAADAQLVVGYRVLEGGREFRFEPLTRVSLNTSVRVHLMLKRGAVSLKLDDGGWLSIPTPLKEASAHLTVSSGVAEFVSDE